MSRQGSLFKSLRQRMDEQRINRLQESLAKRGDITRYQPDPEQGLSPEQIREHYDAGWNNEPVDLSLIHI